jgi:hypothetical protein
VFTGAFSFLLMTSSVAEAPCERHIASSSLHFTVTVGSLCHEGFGRAIGPKPYDANQLDSTKGRR